MASCPDIGGFPAQRICCQFSMFSSCLWEIGSPFHRWESGSPERRGEYAHLPLPTTAPGPLFLTSFPEQVWVVGSRGDCLQNFRECLPCNTPTVVSALFFPSFCQIVVSLWDKQLCSAPLLSLLCFLPPSILAYFQYLILNSSCAMTTPC